MPLVCCVSRLQGDQLIATSGVIYTKTSDYNGAQVKMGQQVVRMQVMGEVRDGGPRGSGCTQQPAHWAQQHAVGGRVCLQVSEAA